MMDITVILIYYSEQSALNKALSSMNKISSRIKSILVFHEPKTSLHLNSHRGLYGRTQFIATGDHGTGETLNDTIMKLTTPYILFLQGTDYLSPSLDKDALKLPLVKTVLGTIYHNRNIAIHLPLLVSTSRMKKEKFLSSFQLPFKEALLPAWLANVEESQQLIKDNLVKQARKNTSANTIEKLRFMQKYQVKHSKTVNPTVSVLITNYNMGKYVETAIVSCLLQTDPFDKILIMDDGSTDTSYDQILQWEDGKQVKVFKKKNEGKARALNELLAYVSSDFIVELDADDWLDADAASVIKKYAADLPSNISVLYGNFRKWKQLTEDVLFKGLAKGTTVKGITDLLSYRFPLGPRIYRTTLLKKAGGFPIIDFENGRLFEDVSVLCRLIKTSRFHYQDFTVYNVREHKESITKNNDEKWDDFLKMLKT
ncbi:glycosyltransferase family A protein [Virgibacillus ndiopensis]|uniref:glycosyltransferase family A protein n=1 Tax=Virgibacillus ndiopensis TaxID=2004408 RepID=UPI000C078D38|nr:glycosyltransferase family A protein [Virgibacillus ndiopensis]